MIFRKESEKLYEIRVGKRMDSGRADNSEI